MPSDTERPAREHRGVGGRFRLGRFVSGSSTPLFASQRAGELLPRYPDYFVGGRFRFGRFGLIAISLHCKIATSPDARLTEPFGQVTSGDSQ